MWLFSPMVQRNPSSRLTGKVNWSEHNSGRFGSDKHKRASPVSAAWTNGYFSSVVSDATGRVSATKTRTPLITVGNASRAMVNLRASPLTETVATLAVTSSSVTILPRYERLSPMFRFT